MRRSLAVLAARCLIGPLRARGIPLILVISFRNRCMMLCEAKTCGMWLLGGLGWRKEDVYIVSMYGSEAYSV